MRFSPGEDFDSIERFRALHVCCTKIPEVGPPSLAPLLCCEVRLEYPVARAVAPPASSAQWHACHAFPRAAWLSVSHGITVCAHARTRAHGFDQPSGRTHAKSAVRRAGRFPDRAFILQCGSRRPASYHARFVFSRTRRFRDSIVAALSAISPRCRPIPRTR